ncbi:MAG: type II toxin-antitoxin system Phd/YefM family antitoxin [Chloroflexi bacterium]|nr:type II toxin-antitoxin system Phd/YefM family antitoxin [Chloroflexota bacterium]
MKATLPEPEIVTRKGKPVSVIIPIKDYEELLERVEDADDVAWLKRARKKPLHYRPLEDCLAEQVVENFEGERTGRRLVRQHNIQPVGGQLAKQVGSFAFAADRMDGLLQFEDGFDNFVTHPFRQGVGDADVDAQRTRAGSLPGGVEQFLPQRKNLLGAAHHPMASLRARPPAMTPRPRWRL